MNKQQFDFTAEKINYAASRDEARELMYTHADRNWFDVQETSKLNLIIDNKFGKEKKLISIKDTTKMALLNLDSLPELEYVIERLSLSRGSFGLLCATGCSGKTMLCQYIACCVSAGLPLFGAFPTKKGSVVHIDMEQSFSLTQRRYIRIAAELKLESLDIERITLANRFDFDKSKLSDVKQELVSAFTGKTLAIIDSLKKISQADENSSEIEIVLNMLRQVAEETNCAILLIHHKGKGKDAKQSGRGHSSIYDSCDVQIDLDAANKIFELSCAKNRDGDWFAGIQYELNDVGSHNTRQNCSERLQFKLLSGSIKNKKSDTRTAILETLSVNGKLNQGSLFSFVKGDRDVFTIVIKTLVDSGFVELEIGPKRSYIYSITSKGLGELDEGNE